MNTNQNQASASSDRYITALLESLYYGNGPLSPEELRLRVGFRPVPRPYGPEGLREFTRYFWRAVESGWLAAAEAIQGDYTPRFTRFWRMRGLHVAESYEITSAGRVAYENILNILQHPWRQDPDPPEPPTMAMAA